MITTFIIANDGTKLMPTTNVKKVRKLLRSNRAVIVNRHPFTIQLTYETQKYVQPLELCVDTGYQYIGVAVKSEKREYLAQQYDLLSDEKQRHDDQRKYRRTRRNRLRYRKSRFDNRAIPKGWLAPSIKHKAECHVNLIKKIYNITPIKDIYLEMGQFDTQLLQHLEEGKPLDYQHGERYGIATLREAVFQRDNHKCVFCGRGLKDGAILHAHHVYYWRGQHGNRLSELATACEKCHTPSNHKEGGKLWGYGKSLPSYNGAAFMNSIRWYIYTQIKNLVICSIHLTYGAKTKITRLSLKLPKSHINDAYSMGNFHPYLLTNEEYYKKRRRNNRCLEKFYDAKYIDLRDGTIQSGKDLSCNRTNRREPRNSEKNFRKYRGSKIKLGRRSIRRNRYNIQPGDIIVFQGQRYVSKGCQNNGTYISVEGRTPISVKRCRLLSHCSGWQRII